MGRYAFHGPVRDPFNSGSHQDRQPHSSAVAASRPGEGGTKQHGRGFGSSPLRPQTVRYDRSPAVWPERFRARGHARMSSMTAEDGRKDFIVEVVRAGDNTILHKPLPLWEHLYNSGFVRKT